MAPAKKKSVRANTPNVLRETPRILLFIL